MTLALALAVSWYAFMAVRHGDGAVWKFYSDQVAGKTGGSGLAVFTNLKDYLLGVLRNFLPWSLLPTLGYLFYRREVHAVIRRHRRSAVFITAWFTLLLAIFVWGSDVRTRYLVPAYPLLAVFVAPLARPMLSRRGIRSVWAVICFVVTGVLIVGGLALVVIGTTIHWKLAVAGTLFIVAAAAAFLVRKQTQHRFSPVVMGMVFMAAAAIPRGFVLPVFDFNPARHLTACILGEAPHEKTVTLWSLERANFLRQLFTVSGGRILVRHFKRGGLPDQLERRPLVLLTRNQKESYNGTDYVIEPCGAIFRAAAPGAIWQALLSGDRDSLMGMMREPLFLARRKAAAGS
jgi:hypothetical protein